MTFPDQLVSYGSNGVGQPTSVSGQGSTTGYSYDSHGRLSGVSDTIAGDFAYSFDSASGQVATLTRPNGVDDQFSFDADARLTARNATGAGGVVVNRAEYSYNPAGLRGSMTDTSGVHGYSYDADGRLTGVTNPSGSGQADEAFSYDTLGNLTSWNGNPPDQVLYNQADQLRTDATNVYGYDNEGRQTLQRVRATGAATVYAWDANSLLRRVTNPDGTTVTYKYDPLGLRISATDPSGTTFDVWAGANLRAVLDPAGQVTSRLVTTSTLNNTLAVTTNGATTYPLADGLGSTTAISDPMGAITSRTSYSAYGIPNTTDPTSLAGYTGHQQDPTGLDYARARYYNPTTGRFLTQDPIAANNTYSYASGSPTNRIDPTGRIDIIGYAYGVAGAAGDTNRLASLASLAIIGSEAGALGDSSLACSAHTYTGIASLTIAAGSYFSEGSDFWLALAVDFPLLQIAFDTAGQGSSLSDYIPGAVLSLAGIVNSLALKSIESTSTEPIRPYVRASSRAVSAVGFGLGALEIGQGQQCR